MKTCEWHTAEHRFGMVLRIELVQVLIELVDTHTDRVAHSTAIDTWQALLADFSELIGEAGAAVLLDRSIRANKFEFPWLPQSPVTKSGIELINVLSEATLGRTRSDIASVTRALLITYIDLVITLIGTTLSEQVIYRVASKHHP